MLEILITLNMSLASLSLSGSVFNPSYSQVNSTNISGNSDSDSGSDTAPKRGSGRKE